MIDTGFDIALSLVFFFTELEASVEYGKAARISELI